MLLSFLDRIRLLIQAGFPASTIGTMLAISQAEAGGNAQAHSPTNDYGWLQVNAAHIGEAGFPATSTDQLYDPLTNARAALYVYQHQGYGAWTTYPTAAATASAQTNPAVTAYNALHNAALSLFSGGSGAGAPSNSVTGTPALFGIGGSTPFLGGIGDGLGSIGNFFGGAVSGAAGGVVSAIGNIFGEVARRFIFVIVGLTAVVLGVALLLREQQDATLMQAITAGGKGGSAPNAPPAELPIEAAAV